MRDRLEISDQQVSLSKVPSLNSCFACECHHSIGRTNVHQLMQLTLEPPTLREKCWKMLFAAVQLGTWTILGLPVWRNRPMIPPTSTDTWPVHKASLHGLKERRGNEQIMAQPTIQTWWGPATALVQYGHRVWFRDHKKVLLPGSRGHNALLSFQITKNAPLGLRWEIFPSQSLALQQAAAYRPCAYPRPGLGFCLTKAAGYRARRSGASYASSGGGAGAV